MHSTNKTLIPVIVGSSVGTVIEWYDFYIFGSLATIIATKFFPQGDPIAALLATLSTYAAGLLVRPFGALFFGRLGDLIGRKYTFMVTLLLMGGSTFMIGLIPSYATIGFFAPLIVLILRLLQGLAIGGEYGGAATFVAEHSPMAKRGFWTSWIQITAPFAFLVSLVVVLFFNKILSPADWDSWGWRLPFLISVFMLIISVYIRKNMAESPLFAHAKAEGQTSINPIKESFGNKENLKLVLLVLFGITMGIGVEAWATLFYIQSFLQKTLFLEYSQVNTIIILALLLVTPVTIFAGWISDKIGRKPLIIISLLSGVLFFRPLFEQIYQTLNLKTKTEDITQLAINKKQEAIPNGTLNYTTTRHIYTDQTIYDEVEKVTVINGQPAKSEIVKTVIINQGAKWKLILMLIFLISINLVAYGPMAAYLVEMFPLKIRYTSLSLPYHVGFGIFGGMALVIATYLVNKANEAHSPTFYLAGLTYPIIIMSISLVISLFYLKEYHLKDKFDLAQWLNLKKAKKILGIVWIILAGVAAYFGIFELGLPKIWSGNQSDMIFGIIVTAIISPITATGLFLLGKYSWQGEYDN